MNKYEAVLLVNPDISIKVLQTEINNFSKQISTNKGNILNNEDWGLRDLSYKISTFKKAFYRYFQIEINGDKIQLIKKSLSLNDKILRHLFIKVDKHQELPTKLLNEKK